MTLKEALERVRNEFIDTIQNEDIRSWSPQRMRISMSGGEWQTLPYDINSGHCKAFAEAVQRLQPDVDVVCMNQFPRYETYQHYVVVDKNGVFYDSEHVDGCTMEELARAYDAPRPTV